MNSIGFDLNDAYFYVHGSNYGNIARFGSSQACTTISVYTGDNSNISYHIGVDDPDDPVLWIGKQLGTDNYCITPNFYIRGLDGNVGIGTSQPQYSIDVWGDIHVTGQLYQKTSNIVILTETVSATLNTTDFLSSCNEAGINVTNTPLSNIREIQVNGNAYIGDTLYASNLNIYNKISTVDTVTYNTEQLIIQNMGTGPAAKIIQTGTQSVVEFYDDSNMAMTIVDGGNVGINTAVPLARLDVIGRMQSQGDVQTHVMGNMQTVRMSYGQIPFSDTTVHEIGFIISWTNTSATDDLLFQVDGTFFGSGTNVRMHTRFSSMVNPQNDNTNLPGEDVTTDKSSFQSTNVATLQQVITRNTNCSVKIGARWKISSAILHKTNIKLELLAPTALGFITAVPYSL